MNAAIRIRHPKRERHKFEPVETPAKLRPGHAATRDISKVAGAPKAWVNENEHPLTLAHRRNQIGDDEFAAGEVYRVFFEMMGKSGRDSTECSLVGAGGQPFSDSQIMAILTIKAMENH